MVIGNICFGRRIYAALFGQLVVAKGNFQQISTYTIYHSLEAPTLVETTFCPVADAIAAGTYVL
jgi:hypothetical protein